MSQQRIDTTIRENLVWMGGLLDLRTYVNGVVMVFIYKFKPMFKSLTLDARFVHMPHSHFDSSPETPETRVHPLPQLASRVMTVKCISGRTSQLPQMVKVDESGISESQLKSDDASPSDFASNCVPALSALSPQSYARSGAS
ncbi:hypothetical protein P691DRAFT_764878 [Macrolepiota fuliginosa MF-IS2]|uniref:Uncharacterized protein n=1 Tax=Macrolepiota fuliginosa MF-IS2 TaxID=1400762 RepID=A0A9P6BWE1_9AGAR|nr:hypothetical protein P691DRAFT_764878 [Macrolepiota fuliginosa MF-IS2]